MKKAVPHILLLLLARLALGIDLPPAPDGFSWQQVPELKAAFLKPTGWFFKSEARDGTLAYFITKEDIDKNGEFQTGLTINVFHPKESAVEHARSFIDDLATKRHGEKWAKDVGPFRQFGCLSKDTDASGTVMTHTLMMANPKTNTLYLFIFESPESEWKVAWKTGVRIMNSLAVDDEI